MANNTIKPIDSRSVHLIQSGQVIIDLCSVVKELVENSLDAGANIIDVRFKNQGLDVIEVQDNGSGIAPENFEAVALKHHTSKLKSYSDIDSLATFGFRGEALASLCALSILTVTTCRDTEVPKGAKLKFDVSGKLSERAIAATKRGTTVCVESLFHNLPVRRRELERNIKREWHKAIALLNQYACIQTNLKFTVSHQPTKGKRIVLFSTKCNRTTRENLINIFGAKTLSSLIPLDLHVHLQTTSSNVAPKSRASETDERRTVHVLGHVSRPTCGEGRQTPDRQMFFVNGRPCVLPQFAKAFNDVYKAFNSSQSPFIFADIQLDTNLYDVNVSPDKRSILLHEQTAMLDKLRSSLLKMFDSQNYTLPTSQLAKVRMNFDRDASTSYTDQGAGKPNKHSDEDNENDTEEDRSSNHSHQAHNYEVSVEASINYQRPVSRQSQHTLKKERTSLAVWLGQGKSNEDLPDILPARPRPRTLSDTSCSTTERAPHLAPRRVRVPRLGVDDEDNIETTANDCSNDRQEYTAAPQSTNESTETPTRALSKAAGSLSSLESPDADHKQARLSSRGLFKDKEDGESLCLPSGSERSSSDADSDDNIEEVYQEGNHSPKEVGANTRYKGIPGGCEIETPRWASRIDTTIVDRSQAEKLFSAAAETLQPTTTGDLSLEANAAHLPSAAFGMKERMSASSPTSPTSDEETSLQQPKHLEQDHTSRTKHLMMHNVQVVHTNEEVLRLLTSSWPLVLHQSNLANEDTHLADIGAPDAESRLSLIVAKEDFAKMKVVGQFNLGFIIATLPGSKQGSGTTDEQDELFIIDQHASDEKYNFERLQANTVVQSQSLVQPKTLRLTALEEETLSENLKAVEANGFKVRMDVTGQSPVGSRCQLMALPLSRETTFNLADLDELLSLLSEAPGSEHVPRPAKARKMFAMRACRSSIMIGKALTHTHMKSLLRHMGELDKPWNCPHGRPTMRHLCHLGTRDQDLWAGDSTRMTAPWKAYCEST